jgi:hypothetical protein
LSAVGLLDHSREVAECGDGGGDDRAQLWAELDAFFFRIYGIDGNRRPGRPRPDHIDD